MLILPAWVLLGVVPRPDVSLVAGSVSETTSSLRAVRPSPEFAPQTCIGSSTCESSMLVTGDPSASTVVVFQHTTYDAGWAAFYALFDGWNPPFYAVAMDMPGTATTAGVECGTKLAAGDSLVANGTLPGPCEAGVTAKLEWYQQHLQELVPEASGKKLFFVGHSMGGTFMEHYIERRLEPAPQGLVLISNPTRTLWQPMYAGMVVYDMIDGFGEQAEAVDSSLVFDADSHTCSTVWNYWWWPLNYILDEFWGSPNFFTDLNWFERYMQAEEGRAYINNNATAQPPLDIEHLLLFGVNAAGNMTWEHVFEGVLPGDSDVLPLGVPALTNAQIADMCSKNEQCTLQYVPIDDHSSECAGRIVEAMKADEEFSCVEEDTLWGHWLHIDNTTDVRAKIEAWIGERMH